MTNPDCLGHRERLRKRFLEGGAKSMLDYELLELLLMIAIPRRDVKPLAKELIRKFGNFAGVINASVNDLMTVDGVKENSATILKIIKESALRMSWQNLQEKQEVVIAGWDDLLDYCRMAMAHNDVEEFRVLFLDTKLRLVAEEIQQRGTIDQVAVHPREVIRSAMNKNATSIVLVHNHPSGDVTPSKADIEITKRIKEAAENVDIQFIDHIIVTKDNYFSFKGRGIV